MTCRTAAMLFAVSMIVPASASALDQPNCASLEHWVAGYDADQTISIAPKVELNALLRGDLVMPLFGSPVSAWKSADFNVVKKMLNDCRRAANKRHDKETADQLYRALKLVGSALKPMNDVARFRESAARVVEWLVDYHRVPELPRLLELGQKALEGEDVEPGLQEIQKYRDLKQHVRTLRQAHDYLAAEETAPLIARLADGLAAVEADVAKVAAEMEAARAELAEVPMTREGAAMLDQLGRLPVLQHVSQEESMAFQTAIALKRRQIQVALQQAAEQQQAARAAQPIAIGERLGELFAGDTAAEASVRGMRPGIPYEEAKRRVERDWGFGSGAGGDLMKQFAPTRRDLDRYREAARRDGGMFEFETMQGRVGQLRFTEHYEGRLDGNAIRAWLVEQFGEPDDDASVGDAVDMTWFDDDTHLQVRAANQTVDTWRNSIGFTSAMIVDIWSQEYQDYVSAAEQRCDELMNKPASDLSIQDKMDLMTGCRS